MLLASPIVLNDGVDATRSFSWLRQVPGETAGLYVESAAPSVSKSLIKSAHSVQKNKKERHLLQSSEIVALTSPDADGPTEDQIVISLTAVHNAKHTAADVEKQIKMLIMAAGVTGFTTALVRGEI